MGKMLSFRFSDNDLNRRLIALAKKSRVMHSVDAVGAIHFRIEDEEVLENDLLGVVRNHAFRTWQVLSSPPESLPLYREYMACRKVPFVEESMDGEVSFLLPGRVRPHSWKIERTTGKPRLSRVG